MFSKLVENVGCHLAFHKWSKWVYQSSGACTMERTCLHCGTREIMRSVLHQFEEVNKECQPAEDYCLFITRQRCVRCGEEEVVHASSSHEFERVGYESDGGILSGSETATYRCNTCGYVKVEHTSWDDRQAYGYPSNWTK